MNRRELLIGLGAACAAPIGLARGNPRRAMAAADVHVDGYPTVEAVKWIGRRLEEQTDGRLRIRMYHSGQLGRESDTVDLTRFGALDLARVNFAPLNNPFPATQVFSLPYVFDSVAHMRRAVDGAVGRAVLESFATRGLVGLAIYDAGSRSLYNVVRPVYEPADLRGMKIRVPPSDIFIGIGRVLGANPTPLPFGEVYAALQTGLIDGAENNWRTLHSSRQFEVARYWAQTDHSYSPEALLMSRRTFDALQPGDRERVLAVAAESVGYMRMLWDRMEAESRRFVIGAGIEVTEVDRQAFERAARPLLETYLAGNELLRSLYAKIRAVSGS